MQVVMGMRYAVAVAHHLGIVSDLEPIRSFPLGAGDVSPYELAVAYRAMLTGKRAIFGEDGSNAPTAALIYQIRSQKGEVIWQAEPRQVEVLSKDLATAMAKLLQGPFQHTMGTARSEEQAVVLDGKVVPLLGKTGTNNGPTVTTFAGCLPTVALPGLGVPHTLVPTCRGYRR